MDELIIRPMTAFDIEDVCEIEAASFGDPWKYASFAYDMEHNPTARHLVSVLDGIICGYVGVYYVLDEGQISNVAVLPDFRRRRVGKKLIGALIEQAKKAGLTHLTLEVRARNLPALSLYKSFGFVQNGLRKNYYERPTEDAILMALPLQPSNL